MYCFSSRSMLAWGTWIVKRRNSAAAAAGVFQAASRSMAPTRVLASPCGWVACFSARRTCRSEGPLSAEKSFRINPISY